MPSIITRVCSGVGPPDEGGGNLPGSAALDEGQAPGTSSKASKTVWLCFCSRSLAVITVRELAISLTGVFSRLAVMTTSGRAREDWAVKGVGGGFDGEGVSGGFGDRRIRPQKRWSYGCNNEKTNGTKTFIHGPLPEAEASREKAGRDFRRKELTASYSTKKHS